MDQGLRHLSFEPLEGRLMLSTLFVEDDAAAGGDGLSWDSAYVSLQDALDRAAVLNADADPDNDVAQVWLAEGTYKPAALSDSDLDGTIDTDPRSATFSLLDGVSLYGGFAGTEAAIDQRPTAPDGSWVHQTVLSGDIGALDEPSDNAYTVLTAIGLAQTTTLDGLSITGGNANAASGGSELPRRSGGGVYAKENTELQLIGSTISGNSATGYHGGGGIFNYSGTLTITNSTISGNSASGDRANGGGSPTVAR